MEVHDRPLAPVETVALPASCEPTKIPEQPETTKPSSPVDENTDSPRLLGVVVSGFEPGNANTVSTLRPFECCGLPELETRPEHCLAHYGLRPMNRLVAHTAQRYGPHGIESSIQDDRSLPLQRSSFMGKSARLALSF